MEWQLVYRDYVRYWTEMRAYQIASTSTERLKLRYMHSRDVMSPTEFEQFYGNMAGIEQDEWSRRWRIGFAADVQEATKHFAAYMESHPINDAEVAKLASELGSLS